MSNQHVPPPWGDDFEAAVAAQQHARGALVAEVGSNCWRAIEQFFRRLFRRI
jgi:hypothetical protein